MLNGSTMREVNVKTQLDVMLMVILPCLATITCTAAEVPAAIDPLVRVVDLTIGESADVALCDGSLAKVKLIDVKETHDAVCLIPRLPPGFHLPVEPHETGG